MSVEIEQKIEDSVIRNIMHGAKRVKLPWLEGLSLYMICSKFTSSESSRRSHNLSSRSGCIGFFYGSFSVCVVYFKPHSIHSHRGFQQDLLKFLEKCSTKYLQAIASIINDILNNSYKGLLSSGFLLSIFLMANGLNAILGGLKVHTTSLSGFLRQYLVALGMSVVLSILLLVTVATTVVFEVYTKTKLENVFNDTIHIIEISRYGFLMLMILITSSILLKFGTSKKILVYFHRFSVYNDFDYYLSYFFGIWVVKFPKIQRTLWLNWDTFDNDVLYLAKLHDTFTRF